MMMMYCEDKSTMYTCDFKNRHMLFLITDVHRTGICSGVALQKSINDEEKVVYDSSIK